MLRQMRHGRLEQLRAGEQSEEVDRLQPASAPASMFSILLDLKLDITNAQGWPRGWLGECLITVILLSPAGLPLDFQSLSLSRLCT
jgi:hypothetical protein